LAIDAAIANDAAVAGSVFKCGAGPVVGEASDPGIKRTVQGTNGTFTDQCDGAGNLVDFQCESQMNCMPGPGPDPLPICTMTDTGKVLSQSYDCSGHCADGTCYSRCPVLGDLLTYISVDSTTGDATLENQTDHHRYVCRLGFDAPGDAYDCKNQLMSGSVVEMVTQGSQFCTGGPFGAFGVGAPGDASIGSDRCDYDCDVPR
jgi:hypothetical protein